MRVRRLGLLLVAVPVAAGVLTVVLSASPDRVTGTVPADGAQLATAPATVALTFTGAVDTARSHLTVATAAGVPVARGEPELAGESLLQPVAITAGGGYLVGYHITFADGAEASGTSKFTVAAGAPAAGVPASAPPALSTATAGGHVHAPVDRLSAAIVCGDAVLAIGLVLILLRRPRAR